VSVYKLKEYFVRIINMALENNVKLFINILKEEKNMGGVNYLHWYGRLNTLVV
jgi:endo-1,4-beta-mannosidase